MYLAPLNYDRFFKKVFSDIQIARQFIEDFFGYKVESIEALPKSHKLTNESSLIEYDYRCKVNKKFVIIDMQQWYKHDIVKRFYLYHCANSVLQLEQLPLKKIGKEKKVKDYSGVVPVKTLIWLVDDALNFKTDYSGHIMLPEDIETFLKDENLWPANNCLKNPEKFRKSYEQLLKKRQDFLEILKNNSKNLMFLKQNRLIFAFQRNIVNNMEKAIASNKPIKPYMRWFDFAAKTRNKNNKKEDFTSYKKIHYFDEIMRKLNHKSLNQSEKDYILYYDELEGIAEVKWKDGVKIGLEKGEKIGLEKGEKIGLEKGEKIGLEKGEKKGQKKEKRETAIRCLEAGMSVEQTSLVCGLSIGEVLEIKNELGV